MLSELEVIEQFCSCFLRRVKTAISKKDEAIQDLRRNLDKSQEQVEHLEAMLERQTKDKFLYGTPTQN